MQDSINTLLKLEEERERSRNKLYHHQQLIKRWFDNKSSTIHDFDIGDLVLKWDKPHKDKWDYRKFQCLWLGSFIIAEKLEPGSVHLQMLQGFTETFPTNVQRIEKYFYSGNFYLPVHNIWFWLVWSIFIGLIFFLIAMIVLFPFLCKTLFSYII